MPEVAVKESPNVDTVSEPVESPAIHAVALSKRYGSTLALADLSMTVQRGEVFGFLGPNGAGKTTAVKVLVGITQPTDGEAWLLGAPIGDRSVRKRIGYLPELFRYQDWLSAREVLAFHCRLAGIEKARRTDEIDHALDLAGIADRANDKVGTYSKGMQQRLGLGVSLLGQPAVVFLDEPTSALDPVGRHDVREIIRTLKDRGTTVFLNSHLLSEVEQVCDRVAVVDKGRVIAQGTLDQLRGAARSLRIRAHGLDERAMSLLARYGDAEREAELATVRNVDLDRVPEIVADLVRAGFGIYEVSSAGDSLEDSFLQMLGGNHGNTDHRSPDAA